MTPEHDGVPAENGDARAAPGYQEILAAYIEELTRAGFVDPDAILGDHPECAAALLEDLQNYADLQGARDPSAPLATLGDYTLRRRIGRGGMGVVYDAWENSMDRRVALKVLPAGVAADNRSFLRFMQEAKTAGQLAHPNIVAVYAMGVKDQTPYYAMEYVEGCTLSELIERMARAPGAADTAFGAPRGTAAFYAGAARAFAGAAEGLHHAHARKVIHRDIKPSNLILDAAGRLRILDFGLARQEGQPALTLSGDIIGTVFYMSPEQARARRTRVDHRTDIYSLGATMYEFFAGRPPFKGSSHQDTISRILALEPAEPHRFRSDLPRALETVILKCLRKEPDDRFGTAEALAQDLRRFACGDPVEARPQPALEKLLRRVRRQIVKIAGGALLLLLALITVLFAEQYRINRDEQLAAAARRAREACEQKIARAVSDIQLGALHVRAALGGERGLDPQGLFGIHQFEKVIVESPLIPIDRALETLRSAEPFPPGMFEGYYHWARALALQKNPSAAIEKLDALLAAAPDFVPGRMLAADLLRELGREAPAREEEERAERAAREPWERAWLETRRAERAEDWSAAEDAYTRLLAIADSEKEPYRGACLETRLLRGQALMRLRAYHRALADFNTASSAWPDAFEPRLLAGRIYYLMEKPLYAEEVYEELHRSRAPAGRDHAAVWVAVMYTYDRDHERALSWARKIENEVLKERLSSYYLMLLGRHEESEAAARASIALDPRNGMAHHMLALALKSRKKYPEAIASCETAMQLEPDDFGPYHTMGHIYYEMMDFPRSIEYSRKSLALKPDYPNTLCNLGVALVRSGSPAEGLEYLERSRRIEPSALTLVFIALTLEALRAPGYVERQIELYEESVGLDPTLWLAWFNWGVVLYQSFGKYEEALEKLLRAEALRADYHTAFAHLARIYERLGNRDDALRYYRKSLEHLASSGREDLVEIMQLGNTLAKTSGIAEIRREGFALLEKAAARWPGDHRVWTDYAAALIENERHDEARAATARALEIDPRHVFALRHRALLGRQAGKPAEAMADLLAALDACPPEERADVHVDLLDLLAAENESSFGGRLDALQALVESELAGKTQDPRLVWHVWLTLSLVHRARGVDQVLEDMDRLAARAPAEGGGAEYAAHIRWALDRLRTTGAVRINCGGGACRGADGAAWEADRFFFGGRVRAAGADATAAADERRLYASSREFPLWEPSAKAYRIPVLPGSYRVTLHFAEARGSGWEPRAFGVRIEGRNAIEAYDTRAVDGAAADRRAHAVEGVDAVLEIEFLPSLAGAFVSAIEVERL